MLAVSNLQASYGAAKVLLTQSEVFDPGQTISASPTPLV